MKMCVYVQKCCSFVPELISCFVKLGDLLTALIVSELKIINDSNNSNSVYILVLHYVLLPLEAQTLHFSSNFTEILIEITDDKTR